MLHRRRAMLSFWQLWFTVPMDATFTKLAPAVHLDMCPWPIFHASLTMVRKKWLSLYYSTYGCYINQTYTSCSSWHDLTISNNGLCPWPIFHAWITMVKKKWLSLYYSIYGCYIHQTKTRCSSWHDRTISNDDLCLWPIFHASLTMVRKKWLSLYYSTYWC